jgi:hypothetical protein
MYPDPAVCKLVDKTDVSDGMKNRAEIVGPLAEKGLLTHPFSRAKGPTMPVLAIAGYRDYQPAVEPVSACVPFLKRGSGR